MPAGNSVAKTLSAKQVLVPVPASTMPAPRGDGPDRIGWRPLGRITFPRLPDLGRHQRLEHGQAPLVVLRMHAINQDQPDHLAGMGAGMQLGE